MLREALMTHVFKHPKYYTELRKRNKSDQAISDEAATAATSVRPDPGHKQQATSNQQAARRKQQASSPEAQASRLKPQVSSSLITFPS